MPIPSVTQKFMCTLFVFTMICGVWQYAAIENTFYFEDRENIVSEEICEYAVTQRIAEHKRLNYNTNTSGIEPLLPLLSLLLGFLLYAPSSEKSIFAACKMIFFPNCATFTGCSHSPSLLRAPSRKSPDRIWLKEALSCSRTRLTRERHPFP